MGKWSVLVMGKDKIGVERSLFFDVDFCYFIDCLRENLFAQKKIRSDYENIYRCNINMSPANPMILLITFSSALFIHFFIFLLLSRLVIDQSVLKYCSPLINGSLN